MKHYLSDEERAMCHTIIHPTALAAAGIGAGLAQFPCSDNALLTPLQLAMTIALGSVFGIEMNKSAARAAIASATGATVGRTASQVLVGWIPGYGNAVNAVTAASVTEGLGWLLADEFARQAAS